ncbi:MAG: hypothetical protein ABSG26_15645, partial [Bryobacteraceae bacterium]
MTLKLARSSDGKERDYFVGKVVTENRPMLKRGVSQGKVFLFQAVGLLLMPGWQMANWPSPLA